MIENLYGKYFQKSRSFLYPALGIKKSHKNNPTGTYISVSGKIEADEMKLICAYKSENTEEFKSFETQMLLSNPLFEKVIAVDDYRLYIFDFVIYKHDWFNFLLGKYSQFSSVLKKAIKQYYGENSAEYKYIETYLYPDKHYETYAQLLGVDIITLKHTGELCDPCDLEKETLKIPALELQIL